jgi:hypothetical protein
LSAWLAQGEQFIHHAQGLAEKALSDGREFNE